MNTFVLGASNSETSINQKWAYWLAKKLKVQAIDLVDLNAYEMPIYKLQREQEEGIPTLAQDFYNKIGNAELIIISFAEYNGSYTTAFKNVLDWVSRIDMKVFQDRKCIFTAVSPSRTGGKFVLEQACDRFPKMGANIIGSFHLPSFHHYFNEENGITDEDTQIEFNEFLASVTSQL